MSEKLGTKRRLFQKSVSTETRWMRVLYFLILCLYDATIITASIFLGKLVEAIQNPDGDYTLLVILVPSLFALGGVIGFLSKRLNIDMSVAGINGVRRLFLLKILERPRVTQKFEQGELIRLEDDTDVIGANFPKRAALLTETGLAIAGYLTVMSIYAWQLTVILILITALKIFVVNRLTASAARLRKERAVVYSEMNGEMLAIIGGAKVLNRLGSAASDYRVARCNEILKRQYAIVKKEFRRTMGVNAINVFYIFVLPSLLTLIGIVMGHYNLVSLAGAFIMLPLATNITGPVTNIEDELHSVQTENKTFEQVLPIIEN